MDHNFWQSRWQNNEIGFHQPKVNDYLFKHFEKALPKRVLVPLCGKSKDLLWLWQQGQWVVGVELTEKACRDFWAENPELGTPSEKFDTERGLRFFETDRIKLVCGDFFTVNSADLTFQNGGAPSALSIYDRAAYIALPLDLRQRYLDHLTSLVRTSPRPVSGLLITIEYDQSLKNGPPFSITQKELAERWDLHFNLTELESVKEMQKLGPSELEVTERAHRIEFK